MLSFQKLDVYRAAVDFLVWTVSTSDEVPRGHGSLLDQLRRAALSIQLNIAEGAGRTGAADAARCYAIARGSAMECAAVLEAAGILGIVPAARRAEGDALLERIVAMLTRLCASRRGN